MTATGRRSNVIIGLIVAAVAITLPLVSPPFRNLQLAGVLVTAIAVLGLNLLTGYGGQISLGHSAFFAVGAYTTSILVHSHGWPILLTLVPAAAVTFVMGFLFGIPALRLEGLYLALVTLGLAVVAPPVLKRFGSITGGAQGLNTAPLKAPAWTGLADDQFVYFLVLLVALVLFVLVAFLVHSRAGRALVAVRDNEIAAEAMGVNPARVKTVTFAWSAMYAGIAGALYTMIYGFVSPDSFTILLAITFIAAMVVGGVASVTGAIFGSLFIKYVPIYSDKVSHALGGVIYGVALIMFMLVLPDGFVGLLRRVRALVDRRGSRSAAGPPLVTAASPFGQVREDAWEDDGGGGTEAASAPAALGDTTTH